MTILVTGASGQLGRLVLDRLLAAGATPADLRAGARNPTALAAYAEQGVEVVALDYDQPDTVAAAVAGAAKVLLISGSEVGSRVPQHAAVVDAAAAAGVGHLVYTSAPLARTTSLVLAPEHKSTEELLEASGLPVTVLRNNWYTENYTDTVAAARATGVVLTSAADGRVASAARADYAAAAAAVLLADDAAGHVGQVYELAGDVAWDFPTFARTLSEVLGQEVALQQVSTSEHVAMLVEAGLDQGTAGFVAALDSGIAEGVLALADGTLARLIGRPTQPLADGLRALA